MKKRTALVFHSQKVLPFCKTILKVTGTFFTTLILTIPFPQNAKAETWSCKYQFAGKTEKFITYRQGKIFNSPDTGIYQIIDENNRKIHLYYSYMPDMESYYAVSFDKDKKIFSMVALSPGNDSEIISGPCKVSN